jgi:hypothetical protein
MASGSLRACRWSEIEFGTATREDQKVRARQPTCKRGPISKLGRQPTRSLRQGSQMAPSMLEGMHLRARGRLEPEVGWLHACLKRVDRPGWLHETASAPQAGSVEAKRGHAFQGSTSGEPVPVRSRPRCCWCRMTWRFESCLASSGEQMRVVLAPLFAGQMGTAKAIFEPTWPRSLSETVLASPHPPTAPRPMPQDRLLQSF